VEPVGQAGDRQGHGQHQADADDGDEELAGAVPQVRERHGQHATPPPVCPFVDMLARL